MANTFFQAYTFGISGGYEGYGDNWSAYASAGDGGYAVEVRVADATGHYEIAFAQYGVSFRDDITSFLAAAVEVAVEAAKAADAAEYDAALVEEFEAVEYGRMLAMAGGAF